MNLRNRLALLAATVVLTISGTAPASASVAPGNMHTDGTVAPLNMHTDGVHR